MTPEATVESSLSLTRSGAVAELTLNRPAALNSLNRMFWNEFPARLTELEHDPEVRVLVLSSTGKHFTAGMDLTLFQEDLLANGTPRRREQLRERVLQLQAPFNRLEKARFPVIAAIQGGCIGGGVDMVCACDLRYATEDAFFCIQEINIGIMADLGTLQRLPKLLPEAVVRALAYTGDRLSAREAHRLGFVNEVLPDAAALKVRVAAVAARIAEKSPLAVSGSKSAITFARDHETALALEMTATWQAGMLDMDDCARAAAAQMRRESAPAYDPLEPLPGPL